MFAARQIAVQGGCQADAGERFGGVPRRQVPTRRVAAQGACVGLRYGRIARAQANSNVHFVETIARVRTIFLSEISELKIRVNLNEVGNDYRQLRVADQGSLAAGA